MSGGLPHLGRHGSAPASEAMVGRFLIRIVPMRVPLALGLSLLATLSATPHADARPIVVELFTSQGCSSCPPADELLTALTRRGDVLPLAFHVTYWNALGWRDPYSFEAATERQAQYATRLGGGSYTPEIVVDGRHAMVGSRRDEVEAAIGTGPDDNVEASVTRTGTGVSVTLGNGLRRGRHSGRVLLIGFDPHHRTPVGRGENGGRTLLEANIVRSMTVIGEYLGSSMTISAPRGAGEDLAVLVQAPDGAIIAAARL